MAAVKAAGITRPRYFLLICSIIPVLLSCYRQQFHQGLRPFGKFECCRGLVPLYTFIVVELDDAFVLRLQFVDAVFPFYF